MELRSGLFLEEVLYRMKCYLAIDIGASSGRHIVGWKDNGELRTEEVYRFPNGVSETDGNLCWDTEALVSHVKTGIEKDRERFEVHRHLGRGLRAAQRRRDGLSHVRLSGWPDRGGDP